MTDKMLTELLTELGWELPTCVTLRQGAPGIAIESDGKQVMVEYGSDADLARSLVLLRQFGTVRAYRHREENAFSDLGVMIDCSRNGVMSPEALRRTFRLLALMGYNMVMLYTEDTYEVEGEPYFGYMRGRYTGEELRELDAYAASLGIELIPCIQVLAHINALTKWKVYQPIIDCNDILLCEDERTYALIDRMLSSLSANIRSRRIHIGMDEAHMVGLGKYLQAHGYENPFDILVRHLNRVCKTAEKYGYHPMMWSDMFFRLANGGNYYLSGKTFSCPDRVFAAMPEDIGLVYWDYYTASRKSYDEMMVAHKKFRREIWFAGGAWCWCGFSPDNAHSIQNTCEALGSCRRNGIQHVFLTAWGDNGAECSFLATLPTLSYAASLAYGHAGKADCKRFFRALTGIRWDDFLSLDAANKLFAENGLGSNPGKCLLYNDPLLGLYDRTVEDNLTTIVAKLCAAERMLNRPSRDPKFGYLFRTQKALVALLRQKCDLGLRARRAYQEKDRAAAGAVAESCRKVLQLLERFTETYRAQWLQERKPHGFDVQDLRLGGLAQRIRTARAVLQAYAEGKTDKIPELEETVLPYEGKSDNVWQIIASANII